MASTKAEQQKDAVISLPRTLVPFEWVFDSPDAMPTQEQVLAALEAIPDQHGIRVVEFAEYVLPMGSWSNKSRTKTVRLYMQVAGRLAMLHAAAAQNEWGVAVEPMLDGVFADGAPGVFVLDGKVALLRERVTIWQGNTRLFSATGTAAVKSASDSNRIPRWEKAETAARGRALAALGFGVLPGSGVASLEEMELAGDAEFDVAASMPKEKDELLAEISQMWEALKQAKGRPDDEAAKTLQVLALQIGAKVPIVDGVVDLSGMNPGQVLLLHQSVEKQHKAMMKTLEAAK